MKNSLIIVTSFILISIGCSNTFSQEQKYDTAWAQWQSLIGTWEGTNSGEPGQGEGNFTFAFGLNGNILIRNGHTVFPGHENQPARIHDDILIVYKENSNIPDKAEYFDSEGHVLHYDISYSTNGIIILKSIPVPGSPVFRLSFIKMDNLTTDVKFEAAPPDKPDDFRVHVEGIVVKTN